MRFAPLIICLAAISLAAPTHFLDGAYDWTDELAEFYGKVSQYINSAKHNTRGPHVCDTSKIAMPFHASGMASPSGLKPRYVALGRGTQVWQKFALLLSYVAHYTSRTIHVQTPLPDQNPRR
jgi:hypothetical protein